MPQFFKNVLGAYFEYSLTQILGQIQSKQKELNIFTTFRQIIFIDVKISVGSFASIMKLDSYQGVHWPLQNRIFVLDLLDFSF